MNAPTAVEVARTATILAGLMLGIWMIGLGVPAAMAAATLVAFVRAHPHRRAIAVGALVGGGFALSGWMLARVGVADSSRTGEILFLQMSIASVACFVFAVAAMIAGRVLGRR